MIACGANHSDTRSEIVQACQTKSMGAEISTSFDTERAIVCIRLVPFYINCRYSRILPNGSLNRMNFPGGQSSGSVESTSTSLLFKSRSVSLMSVVEKVSTTPETPVSDLILASLDFSKI